MAFFGAAGGGLLSGMFSAISGIVGAIGQAEAAEAQAAVAQQQAALARQNAEIQRRNSAMVAEFGRQEAYFQSRKNRAMLAEQEASMSASGVKVGSPSFLRARESLAKVAGEEAGLQVKATDMKAWNYRASAAAYEGQARVYETQAAAYEAAASNALLGGFIGAFGSLIGSARSYTGPQVNLSPRTWYTPRYS